MLRHRALLASALVLLPVSLAAACKSGGASSSASSASSTSSTSSSSGAPGDPGALVDATMTSTVGVLLDEVPMSERDRVATALLAKPSSFWTARAVTQAKLTIFRLVFRQNYYPFDANGNPTKDSLPLPLPAGWDITLSGAPKRQTVDGHDLVAVDYSLATTLLTTETSPGKSEPALAKPGGTWDEPFTFPIDPELVFQRTGFACMDEAEFPPNSVDPEEVDEFYDQTCGVEGMQTRTGCHLSALPQLSCVQALEAFVGHVDTKVHFERKAWSQTAADTARMGAVTTDAGANLTIYQDEFHENRVIYRYIDPSSCTLAEKCVGGAGWRRLLQFSTADINSGNDTLTIGSVEYDGTNDAGTPLSAHGVFEWSPCHEHFHFMHYGTFSYGSDSETTSKRGFCLQSTLRTSNNELSPLSNVFYDCSYQGIEIGWADEYRAGLECQWIDVTTVPTTAAPTTQPLSFHSNPDGFLCEGKPVLDKSGNQVWEPTAFKTATGQPVDKPECNFTPNWSADNVDSYDVTLPLDGDGYVTAPCTRGQLGPHRNCGFTKAEDGLTCTPGATVTLSCTVPSGAAPQVVRACERSNVLKTGIPCTESPAGSVDDQALVSASVDVGATPTMLTFKCPAARDAKETGGGYALYTGPVFTDDAAATVTCTAM